MTIQFFGQYLLQKGRITREQLLGALRIQEDRNLPLKVIAVRRRIMTEEQVDKVSRQQLSKDRSFEQLAVEQGFLTEEQVAELCAAQQKRWVKIGEALVKSGHLSAADVEHELSLFQQAQAAGQEQLEQQLAAAPHRQLTEAFVAATTRLLERMAGLQVKLSEQVIADGGYPPPRGFDVRQQLTGDAEVVYCLNLAEDLVLELATKLFKRELTEVSAAALDAASELVNTITGSSCARLSAQGISLQPEPPVAQPNLGDAPPSEERGTVLTFLSPAGDFELLLIYPA